MTTLHEKVTTAYVQSDELVLDDFHETDTEVVAFVRMADDAEAAVHRCLEMGARALGLAGATLDTQLVEHRFETMTSELGRAVAKFAENVDDTAEKLLGEEGGSLKTALEGWLEDVTSTLDATFDETSKRSAIAKLENVLERARTEQVRSVRALLDPENEESPLADWRREIVKTIEGQGRALDESIGKLREQLAIDEAVAVEAARGTQKGRDFESEVVDRVTEIVRHLEDVPEHTGDVAGSTGGKVGDAVVTVNPAQTPGRSVRYVLEAKDKRMTLKAALAELDAAMENRDAEAGVMVFASQAICPLGDSFQWFDHKAIVVLDRDTLDTHALRLACSWARWTACRESAEACEEIDLARISALIDQARRTLKTATAIRGSHTRAKKAIDDAGRQLDELSGEIDEALDLLEGEIAATA